MSINSNNNSFGAKYLQTQMGKIQEKNEEARTEAKELENAPKQRTSKD